MSSCTDTDPYAAPYRPGPTRQGPWQGPVALLVSLVGNGLWVLVDGAAAPRLGVLEMAPFVLITILPAFSLVLPWRPLLRFVRDPGRHWLDAVCALPALAVAVVVWRLVLWSLHIL